MEEKQEFNSETEAGTYADYPIVKYQIQRYYYLIIENHRKYRELGKRNKKNPSLKINIQSMIETLYGLMENYEAIKKSKETILCRDFEKEKEIRYALDAIFKMVGEFELTNKIMSDETLTLCIKALRKSHVIMGLGDIETKSIDLQDRYERSY
jgi:hypothetical protein